MRRSSVKRRRRRGRKGAFINRLKFLLKRTNQSCPSGLLAQLQKSVGKNAVLDIPRYPGSEKYTELLLNCLDVEPSITEVVIPKGGKSTNWVVLATCLRTNSTLVKVKTFDPITADVLRVADALSSNADKRVVGFAFSGCELNASNFAQMTSLLQAVPLQEIQFEKVCDGPVLNEFFENPAARRAMASVAYLNLRLIKQLNLNGIVSALPNLRKIDIIAGQINLSDVFEMLQKAANPFESVRINGGFMKKPVQSMSLPPTLSDIKFGHCEWTAVAFISTWSLLISHQTSDKKLSLSFSSTVMTPKRWEKFFAAVTSAGCPDLVSFAWDENPLDRRLLKFLLKSPALTKLNADGCLQQGSDSVNDFADFLNASKSIAEVSIRGTEKSRLGTSAEALFRKLTKNKLLKVLDVSNNDFKDDGLTALGELLVANKVLEAVKFRNNNIATGRAYADFFTAVMNRGPKLNIEWPEKEIHALRKAKQLRSATVNHMMDCYAIIRNGNLKVEVDQQSDLSDDENVFAGWTEDVDSETESNEQIPLARMPSNDRLTGSNVVFEETKWKLAVPPVQPPSIEMQIAAMNRTYTTDVLLQRLKTL